MAGEFTRQFAVYAEGDYPEELVVKSSIGKIEGLTKVGRFEIREDLEVQETVIERLSPRDLMDGTLKNMSIGIRAIWKRIG